MPLRFPRSLPSTFIFLAACCLSLPSPAAETQPATAPATRPALLLGPQTTIITEPLNPDGTPNYLAALDAELSQGITPENNAAIPLLRALGPKAIFDDKVRPIILQKLKLDLPEAGPYFILLTTFAQEQHAAGPAAAKSFDYEVANKAEDATEKKPWDSKDFPLVVAWLDANKQPLAQITGASRLPRIYYPLVSAKTPPSLVDTAMAVSLGGMRGAANAFSTRAMLHLSRDEIDDARDDIETIRRLARLSAQQPFLISYFVAVAIDNLAFQDQQTLLQSAKLTPAQSQKLLADLRALPELHSPPLVDRSERFFGLDSLMPAVRGQPAETLRVYTLLAGPNLMTPPEAPSITLDGVDWNVVLRTVNRRYEEQARATDKPLVSERREALKPLILEQQAAGLPASPYDLFAAITTQDSQETRAAKSKQYMVQLGQYLSRHPDETQAAFSERIALFFTRIESYSERLPIVLDRATATHRITLIAAALNVYHTDHAQYPDTLDPLHSPAYLPTLPLDPFTSKPFIYRPTKSGYLLYSTGDNGIDDGGKDRTAGGDDIVMHIP